MTFHRAERVVKRHGVLARPRLSGSRDLYQRGAATNKERALRMRDPRSGGAYVVDGRDNAWRSRAPGPHAHGNAARQVVDSLRTEVCGQQNQSNDPGNNQHNPQYANYWAPLTRKRHILPHPAQPQHTNHGAPRMRKRHQQEHRSRNMRRKERVTVQGPVKKQQTDGMSHKGAEAKKNFLYRKSTFNFGPL